MEPIIPTLLVSLLAWLLWPNDAEQARLEGQSCEHAVCHEPPDDEDFQ